MACTEIRSVEVKVVLVTIYNYADFRLCTRCFDSYYISLFTVETLEENKQAFTAFKSREQRHRSMNIDANVPN